MKNITKKVLVGMLLASGVASAQDDGDLSLDSILTLSPASLIDVAGEEVPATVYSFTAKDLKASTARDMTQFIQRNVVGSDTRANPWNNHGWSFRGIMHNRAENTLFNVNGEMQNARGRDGIVGESVLGLFGDIEQVDVVVGPGSVIHGPGAIAGVVNYQLKDGRNEDYKYMVEPKVGNTGVELDMASIFKWGASDNNVIRLSAGYKSEQDAEGEWGGKDTVRSGNTPGLNTLDHSFEGREIDSAMRLTGVYSNKAMKLGSWFRYYDVVWYPNHKADAANVNWGGANFGRGYYQKNLSLAADKRFELGSKMDLKTTLAMTTTNFGIVGVSSNQSIDGTVVDRGEEIESLSETRTRLRVDLSSKVLDFMPWAVGAEVRMDDMGNSFLGEHERVGTGAHPDVGQLPYVKKNYTNNALFGELQLKDLIPFTKVVAGFRADSHTLVDTFAPRLGFLFFDSEKMHNVRLVYQVAHRTGGADDYELNRFSGATADPDEKHVLEPAENKSIELGYKLKKGKSVLDVVAYNNDLVIQEWDDGPKETVNKELATQGAEVSYEYSTDDVSYKVSHSYTTIGDSKEDTPNFLTEDNKEPWNFVPNITRFTYKRKVFGFDTTTTGAYLWGIPYRQDIADDIENDVETDNEEWLAAPSFKLDFNMERKIGMGTLGIDLKNIVALFDETASLDYMLIEDPASRRYATSFQADLPQIKAYYTMTF